MLEMLTLKDAASEMVGVIEALQRVDPAAFSLAGSDAYNNIRHRIAMLAWGIQHDPAMFKAVLDSVAHSTEAWLPLEHDRLEAMTSSELHVRLQVNISGERWVEGALIKAYKAGTLLAALKLIQADLATFFRGRDEEGSDKA